MKLFIASAWIDDRQILSDEKVKASNLYVAIIHAARKAREKKFRPGSRKRKLSIRVEFVDSIDVE